MSELFVSTHRNRAHGCTVDTLVLCRWNDQVLLVTLLDGRVVAVNQKSGRTIWTFDSGSPLVSARQSLESEQPFNVIPGSDGGLYTYRGMNEVDAGIEVSTMHVEKESQQLSVCYSPTVPLQRATACSYHCQVWHLLLTECAYDVLASAFKNAYALLGAPADIFGCPPAQTCGLVVCDLQLRFKTRWQCC